MSFRIFFLSLSFFNFKLTMNSKRRRWWWLRCWRWKQHFTQIIEFQLDVDLLPSQKGKFVISIFYCLCGLLFLYLFFVFGVVFFFFILWILLSSSFDRPLFWNHKNNEENKLCSVGVVFLTNVLLPYSTGCHTKVMTKVCQFFILFFFFVWFFINTVTL